MMKLSDHFLIKHPFWFYVRRHPRSVFIGMLALFATNALDAAYPLLLKTGIDQIEKRAALDEVGRTAFLFFVLMASLAITRYGWRIGFGYFHSHAAEHIRQKIFSHLTFMGPKFFNKNPVGELMSLLTSDVQSFRQAIGPGLLILADGIMIILMVFPIMWSLNADWTLNTLIFLPAVPFLIWKVMRLIHANYKTQQDRFSDVTAFAQENIGGIRVVKSYALEDRRLSQFDEISQSFEKACNRVAKVDSMWGPVMQFGIASGSVILLFIAQDDILSGAASIGTFVAFHRYIQKMVWPMSALGMGLSMFQKGWASFDRIKDVLTQESNIVDQGQLSLEKIEKIQFEDVSFTYPESQVPSLSHVSFTISRGDRLGIIGPVGAGKTTLLNLLLRLYSPTSGRILINDLPIESYTLESLRAALVLIPQEPFLFSDSVTGNLSFARTVNTIEQNNLLKTVDLFEEVANMPEKENTLLGERGVNLSGGQKQRLAIARGLACNSEVIILDDSLSAVDTKTENKIESLLQQHSSCIRIVVAHRLSSLKAMQKVLVLKDGQVEAFGDKDYVARTSTTYREVEKMQNHSTDLESL
ncbi:MAG: ABC transporter ATP-binding protein [Bdellovibrionia bacterium]